ncbi:MAG: hypothetical protein CMD25_07875 [Flavobacteriales bacterium]|jgi:hypothetical protein|nr:hypothetical protein [Flavobacteriales bacterium]|tara:strand:+ start:948 stop:1688 length:741 start_codon:yes stop_codon:yes gene_type:complete
MPTNVYFDLGTTSEQRLYENLIIEQLRAFGHDVYYLPRKLVNEDTLFGEDRLSSFNDAYIIEMYLDNVEGFEGQKEMMTRFGLDMQDEATWVVSKRRFEQLISTDQNLIVSSRPNEGDLIYFPLAKKLFEISFVDHDDPFYQIQNLPVFKMRCRTFEYSSERLDTGVTAIDNIETNESLDALQYQFVLETGTDSGTNYLLTEDGDFIVQEDYNVDTIDTSADNTFFETQGDSILDFSEVNPFGEVT